MDAFRELIQRLRDLSRRRLLLGALIAASLAGAALTRLPLFEVPGFELGAAMALMLVALAGAAGIASARQERARTERLGPAGSPTRRVGLAFGAAAVFSLLSLSLPFLAGLIGALTSSRCSPWIGIGFFLLLPVPSGLIGAATGLAAGLATKKAWTATIAYAAIVLASVALSAWPLYAGPQVFALDHFVGYFPGPLYDEALAVDLRILAFRGLTLLWTAVLLLVETTLLDPRRARLGRPAPTLGRVAGLLALAAGIALYHAYSFELGLRTTDEELARALGGRSETAHLIIHFPKTKPAEEVRRLERDLEFDWERLGVALDLAPERKITVWVHRDPDQKRHMVGAARTDYAKPWRREFHVDDEPFPHHTARHEMAHVFGAEVGSPVFGVSARNMVFVNIGLVEGLAVAAGDQPNELTLHEWAAAMRKLGLAPDIRSILAPVGFYGEPPSRAYTLAGSFLRFVADTYGRRALQDVYASGDFQGALGKGLDEVAREWEAFLDELPLSPQVLNTAQVRFERGSIFARPCAREVALLQQEAAESRAADPDLALSLYRRCQRIEPDNPAHLRAEAELLDARDDAAGAAKIWDAVLAKSGESGGAKAQALLAIGDLAWKRGDLDRARESFQKVLDLHRDQATDRMAWVKLEALGDPGIGPAVRRYFESGADLAQILELDEAAASRPDWATGPYLVGRQLLQRGSPRAAVAHLLRAGTLGLGTPELKLETMRLLSRAAYLAGDCALARQVLAELPSVGSAADRAFAEDWRARCDFEDRVYGGPIKSAD